MSPDNDQPLVVKGIIADRINKSIELIERMGVTQEQFERVALNALVLNPEIVKCTTQSLDQAVLRCAEVGLLPDGVQAAIIPYKDKASFIPMITGKIVLARRATKGLVLRARCVYEQDDWKHVEGMHPELVHRPNKNGIKSDEAIIAVYATAIAPDWPEPEWEVLYRPEIDRYRARAASTRGPWSTDYAEMAEKTVLGLVLKRLPRRPGENDVEDALFAGEDLPVEVAVVDVQTSQSEQATEKPRRRRGRPRKVAEDAPPGAPVAPEAQAVSAEPPEEPEDDAMF